MNAVSPDLPEWPTVAEAFPCLRALPADEWTRAMPQVKRFPAGAVLFRQEEASRFALFLLDGAVRISSLSEDGREATSNRLQAGDICALMVLSGLSDRDYPGTMTAEAGATALFVAKSAFLRWIQAYEPIRNAVFGNILDGIIQLGGLLAGKRTRPLESRLAETLLKRAPAGPAAHAAAGADEASSFRMTHRQLAAELGSAREVVSRSLAKMQKRGWIAAGRGWIALRDRAALEALVGDPVTEEAAPSW